MTGKGRAFCAGGDIKWFQDMTPQQLDALFVEARKIIIDMLEVEQPIIAAVNGPATGLGATLALFSDVIFAADNAKIGDPHVRVGVVAGDGGAVIWPWLVGAARAKEFLMTGDIITAAEAERIGLINRVVPADQLISTLWHSPLAWPMDRRKLSAGLKYRLIKYCATLPTWCSIPRWRWRNTAFLLKIIKKRSAPSSKNVSRSSRGDSLLSFPSPSGREKENISQRK